MTIPLANLLFTVLKAVAAVLPWLASNQWVLVISLAWFIYYYMKVRRYTWFSFADVTWPTTVTHFLWLRVLVLELSSFLGKFLLSLILVYRIYQRSGVDCLRPLSFGLACLQSLYIFYTSFWEFGWFLLEAFLLFYSRESRTASGLVVMVLKSLQSVIFQSTVRYLS